MDLPVLQQEKYHVAIYLRLSRDDFAVGRGADIAGSRTESNSISSQRDMICGFIKKQDNMEIYDSYADDGYSGTNFDRPEFQRMMRDVEAGNVNCVIVKDLSRLGRDYIEAGRLIQKTFPAFSVRFIALTDHFDSLTADYNELSLVVPVKNFVNDAYSRDISAKVRSHQRIRRENGDFIGAFTAYGYRKCGDNRNRLVPDDYAAGIVKRIFAWKIEGCSNLAIAERLNGMGILSPMEYKKMQGERFRTGFVTGVQAKWSAVAVKRILTNENYTGTLVQGKEEKINYKIKKSVRKPEQEWTRVREAHEAIIPEEDFAIVQDLLQTGTRSHIYAGILFCGDCGKPLVRRVNRYKGRVSVSFICPTRNKGGNCGRHRISEETLGRLVLTGLRVQTALLLDEDRVLAGIWRQERNSGEAAVFEKELEGLRREQERYSGLRAVLYEDLKKQIITEEDFRNFGEIYEKRYRELRRAAARQEEAMKKLLKPEPAAEGTREALQKAMRITELDRLTLVSFVKRILIYEDQRVSLELRYKAEICGCKGAAGRREPV